MTIPAYTPTITPPFSPTGSVPADIIIMAGSVHDRYLSATWKQFFDRSFFKGHTPGLDGKQIGFVIAGAPASDPAPGRGTNGMG